MSFVARRQIRLALLAGALAALLAATAGPAGAAAPSAASARARTIAFWTPERIRAARPLPMTLGRGVHAAIRPTAKPAPSASATAVAGSEWLNGKGTIYRATGRVLFATNASDPTKTQYWICSGAVVTDQNLNASIVLTAGHCAYDQANHVYVQNWLFIPQFDSQPDLWDCGNTAYGCWTADQLFVHSGFAGQSGFNQTASLYDWAFAVVHAGGKNGAQLDQTVGSFPIAFASYASRTAVSAFGYPAAGKYAPGNELVYCSGSLSSDFFNFNRTYALTCDMTGGASGGPWLTSFNSNTGDSGVLSSVNSYRYSFSSAMYGPKFNANTKATWDAAVAAE